MEHTLQIGDRLIVDKLSVDFGTINRVPGDHLTSKGNTIYVNGKPLKEAWTHIEPLGPAIGSVTVHANHYFMMGDNHSDSCDSRSWGTVPRSDIIGKAFVRIWPLSRIGFL
jgi:signal peptidase I